VFFAIFDCEVHVKRIA